MRQLNPGTLIRTNVEDLRRRCANTRAVELVIGDGLPDVECEPDDLLGAVADLVDRACTLSDGGAGVLVEVQRVRLDDEAMDGLIPPAGRSEGLYVSISVTWTGSDTLMIEAMADRSLAKAESVDALLYRTSAVVDICGGAVRSEENGEGQATLTLLLPRMKEARPAVPAGLEGEPDSGPLVLVVDDDEYVQLMVGTLLKQGGFSVANAESGEAGIARFVELGDAVAVILLDLMLPKMHGEEVYDRIREISADVPIVFSSGYSSRVLESKGMGDRNVAFLPKPYQPAQLVEVLNRATGRSNA